MISGSIPHGLRRNPSLNRAPTWLRVKAWETLGDRSSGHYFKNIKGSYQIGGRFLFSPDCVFCTLLGRSPPQPVVPVHKDKSGALPVRSIYDDISSPGLGTTPLTSRRQVIDISSFMTIRFISCFHVVIQWGSEIWNVSLKSILV